jgi:hypothetical protein
MRKRTSGKLALSKETLLKLKGEELKQVVGAANATIDGATCLGTCFGWSCDICTQQSLCFKCWSEGWGC